MSEHEILPPSLSFSFSFLSRSVGFQGTSVLQLIHKARLAALGCFHHSPL